MGHGTRVVMKGGEFNSKTKVAVDNPNQPRGVKVEVVEAQAEHEEQGGGGTTIRMKGLGSQNSRKARPGETRVAILDGPKGQPVGQYIAEEVHSQEELEKVVTGRAGGGKAQPRVASMSHRDEIEKGDRTLVDAALASVREADQKAAAAQVAKNAADAENATLKLELEAMKKAASEQAAASLKAPGPSVVKASLSNDDPVKGKEKSEPTK